MTNDQFNKCKLPKRLDFKTVEAARLFLVHNIKVKDALALTGMNQASDVEKLTEAIKLFEECL